ncbi:MAG: 4-hydroxy-tetrahydrodipicolinate synthase [Saprospirales bacterium]|nr:MAG: 4-hydroxy-tetrahydrodipicolinate synthase [Saprospirales bacterium]
MKNIKLWTALITPLNQDGTVSFTELEKLIRLQEAAGNGILILGSTGEGLAFSNEEKTEIIKFVSSLNIMVPIMAGVGGFNLTEQIVWINQCNSLNIDAFLLVTPLYAKPGPKGQLHWFRTLLDASQKPCMLYNVPSRTAVKMDTSVLNELNGHYNLWAVKEASGNIIEYLNYRNEAPELLFFSGDDALTAFFNVAGCQGLVSVASNIWPKATNLYVEHCLSGKTDNLFPVWNKAIDALFEVSSPVPAKLLLREKGIIKNATLRPPLHEEELKDLSVLLQADKDINNWYLKNK